MKYYFGKPKPMIVELEWYEYKMAAQVGLDRKVQSILNGHKDRYGSVWTPISDVGWSVVSAVAECAVAKALGMYWDGSINTFSRPDLGDYEIKAQLHHTIDPNKHSNFLVIKPNSPNHLVHILVLVHSNTKYEVVGFRRASDAKFERYEAQVGNRPMFYRVPADELDNISLLQ